VAPKQFTKAHCDSVGAALSAARGDLNNQKVPARVTARQQRDGADNKLRSAMISLVGELTDLLAADAPEWYYFGLVPPGGAERPAVPDGIHMTQVGPAAVAAGWPHSPRAEKYRPFKKLDGVDGDFIALELTHDTQVLLQNLPPHGTVHFQLTAYNAAGESNKSTISTLTLT
jgi:hypothetical protein